MKLQKKQIDLQAKEQTLFTKKPNKTKFTFEFYEGHYLEQFILLAENIAMSEYDRNCLLYVKNHLNQQLC